MERLDLADIELDLQHALKKQPPDRSILMSLLWRVKYIHGQIYQYKLGKMLEHVERRLTDIEDEISSRLLVAHQLDDPDKKHLPSNLAHDTLSLELEENAWPHPLDKEKLEACCEILFEEFAGLQEFSNGQDVVWILRFNQRGKGYALVASRNMILIPYSHRKQLNWSVVAGLAHILHSHAVNIVHPEHFTHQDFEDLRNELGAFHILSRHQLLSQLEFSQNATPVMHDMMQHLWLESGLGYRAQPKQ